MDSATRHFVYSLLNEIGQAELWALLEAAALWAVFGAGLGAALAIATYRGFRHVRWYGATSTAGRWLQRALLATSTLVCIGLGGIVGLCEGVHRQCPETIARSRFGTDVLPYFSHFFAEAFAWIDLSATHRGVPDAQAAEARVAAFRAGQWELNAPRFLQRLEALRAGVVREILQELEAAVLKETPSLQRSTTGKLLRALLHRLGSTLVEERLSGELRRRGVSQLNDAVRHKLIAEAARTGDPATIGYHDLSQFILREGLAPAVVQPIRSFLRQQQAFWTMVVLLSCLLPALTCRLCRHTPPPAPL